MAPEGSERASQAPSLTSLPRVEDLPSAADGYDREKVRESFEAYRRHTTQLQVQLRVLQAAGQSGAEPTGHAVRMDAMHLIRAAAEMADTIERDAQTASAAQLRRTEEEVRGASASCRSARPTSTSYRQESERQRAEMVNAAKSEARKTTQEAEQQASKEITRGRVAGGPPARAGPPPGDRAHERDARRGRADARVGARRRPARSSAAPRKAPSSCSPPPVSATRRSTASRSRSSAPRRPRPRRAAAPGLRPPSPARSSGARAGRRGAARPRLRVSRGGAAGLAAGSPSPSPPEPQNEDDTTG